MNRRLLLSILGIRAAPNPFVYWQQSNRRLRSEIGPICPNSFSLLSAQRPQQGRRPQGQRPKQSEAASQAQGRGGQTSNNRPQNQLRGQDTSFGVGSASIQSRNNNQPQIDIDIVQYDATIPDEDEDVDVPILLADPFNEAAERPLTLYGAPPRGR